MEIHRDIYSGMVATALDKEGYFGEEINLYAFWGWDGREKRVHYCQDERQCVQEMLRQARRGCLVSDHVLLRERVYEQAGGGEALLRRLCQKVQDKLTAEQGCCFAEAIRQREEKAAVSREDVVAEYLTRLPADKRLLIPDILGWCLAEKRISRGFYDSWMVAIAADSENDGQQDGKEMAGFSWLADGERRYYHNAYLPTAWRKWRECQQQWPLVSILAVKRYPRSSTAYEIKAAFAETLETLLDGAHFAFWQQVTR